ncbi:MAG TPA: DUF3710 domain-containing protein [Flexivirga sp.]|uniref:DUF3710 domain-containing protein n=1 Tax=Flexivirga sp. TaxID=1962927 RepID=UPI002BE6A52D|nr:DUF3710 domain-containing protein [Flexivirga sp.]HWC20791.1 DUF3710 domain-containing protein [Flexivirga sp.]
MAIFRRKAKETQADTADVTTGAEQDNDVEQVEESDTDTSGTDTAAELDATDASDAPDDRPEDEPDADARRARLPRPHDLDRSNGPFDRSEVKDLDGHLDFGAVAIVPEAGMELRLDVDDAGQEITGITAVIDGAACQVQAFAAPKSRGVWDDIRDEIADNLLSSGGTAEEKLGPLGIELHTRMPTQGPDGRTTYAPARFVGVDGPRWFLRAVLSGNAALDEATGDRLVEFLRRSVITRGGEPRAPREMLPLQIPQDVQNQADAEAAALEQDPNAKPDQTGDKSDTTDDFKPFERGPEITEVR